MNIKESMGDRVLLSFMYAAIAVFAIMCLLPFVTVISSSIATETSLLKYGFSLFPKDVTLEAYRLLFKDNTIYKVIRCYDFCHRCRNRSGHAGNMRSCLSVVSPFSKVP